MWRFALDNLLSRPARSGLALLGLSVAVAGMVGLLAIAAGLSDMVERTFRTMPGVAAMQPGAPIPLLSRLPAPWVDEVRKIDGVGVAQAELWARAHLVDGNMTISPPRLLFGADLEAMSRLKVNVFRDSLMSGRFLETDDVNSARTVVSRQISEQYGKGLGDTLTVDGQELEIVGIYECGTILLDVVILIDIQTLRRITYTDDATISSIYIEPTPGVSNDEIVDRVQEHFRGRTLPARTALPRSNSVSNPPISIEDAAATIVSRLSEALLGTSVGGSRSPDEAPASQPTPTAATLPTDTVATEEPAAATTSVIEVRSTREWGDRVEEFSGDLHLFLYIMTVIALSTAVVSVVNTMLMSVSERLVEFGVLRANGWRQQDVLSLICRESGLIGFAGGVIGAAAGWTGTHVINATFPLKAHLVADARLLLFSVAFSTLLGVAGGLYPARWASRVSPMEAIRKGS